MSWIRSRITLARHPKTRCLCRLLGTSLPAAIGHLHLLWYWTLEFSPDGDLSAYTDEDIADAAQWEGDPHRFVEALVLAIHDWEQCIPTRHERVTSMSRPRHGARRGEEG